ncbi:MAG: AIR synthase [Chloroflexi bacterium]|nr:AIR synthase [Chloroflexota bacterium]
MLPLGKLPSGLLADLLSKHAAADPRVVVGPGVGLDCAVMDFGDRYLVAKSDPITFATDAIGWYAVQVNANDIACSGATPRFFLATILLPESKADAEMADTIFAQITRACGEIGASHVGGHTEITYGIDRPIVIGTMLGDIERDRLITAGGAEIGDAVIVTKGVPVEATAIIAREKSEALAEKFSPEFLAGCRDFLYQPGISVVRDARIAIGAGRVTAMHDPTEGGLATGLWELAEASGRGMEIEFEAVPILPEGRALCAAFGLDPMGAIASGSLLLTAPPQEASRIVAALAAERIAAHIVGSVSDSPGVRVHDRDGVSPLHRPARDEIARLFE